MVPANSKHKTCCVYYLLRFPCVFNATHEKSLILSQTDSQFLMITEIGVKSGKDNEFFFKRASDQFRLRNVLKSCMSSISCKSLYRSGLRSAWYNWIFD